MLRLFFLLSLIGLLLSSCVHHHSTSSKRSLKYTSLQNVQQKNIQQMRMMPLFHEIIVKGNVNINLHTGYLHPQVILRGNEQDIMQTSSYVKNNTLIISATPYHPPLWIDIQAASLTSFTYQGVGVITGQQIHSDYLNLTINNPGRTVLGGSISLRKVVLSGGGFTQIQGVRASFLQISLKNQSKAQLIGVMNLSSLDLNGNGMLEMYWIKSKELNIHSKGTTFIQMAGVVDQLDLELWDIAQFKGRYLRANRSFVRTHDGALAEISALRHQHTLAEDRSNIYYYQIADTCTNFMTCSGAVLDMREWNLDPLREYDRFNK